MSSRLHPPVFMSNLTVNLCRCSCDEGYALAADGRSCGDINECLLSQDDCDSMATCTNTVGGWNCTCDEGKRCIHSLEICMAYVERDAVF